VITFKETPSDMPPALRYWYYAGERAGNEFVYPKSQAMTIARASGEGVMAVDTDATDVNDWKGTPSRVTADAEPTTAGAAAAASTAAEPTTPTTPTTPAATGTQPATTTAPSAPAAATQPTTASQPATAAPPMQPAPEQTAPAAAPRPETAGTSGRTEPSELPRTAGELPTIGLIALFALAGGVALRMARKTAV
jgi:hypothetical protein